MLRAFADASPDCEVTWSRSLREAIGALEREPDIIVTDYRLPDGKGTSLLEAWRDAPLVVITSQGDETVAVDAIKAGAVDYVVKSEQMLFELPRVVERQGAVGLLLNNASHFERDTWDSVSAESWQAHLQPNLRAPFLLSQAMARLLPAERRGLIVNMLDQRVLKPQPTFVSYGLSKSGLWALTQSLALALAPRIRVNGIGPGYLLPDPGEDPEHHRRRVARQPLGRAGSLDEVAAALQFFIEAASVTGQLVAPDGGQHLA